jgi:type VI secretion system secreted protein Hcp
MAITLNLTLLPYNSTTATTIEVTAFSFDAVQTLNIGSQSSGAGAGKVTFNPFSFTRRPDEHSADLWARLCSGTAFQKVTATATKTGPANPVIFTFTMGLVAIKTISLSGAESDNSLVETVTVEYGQAAYSAATQNADGTIGTPVGAGWNRVANVRVDPAKVGV